MASATTVVLVLLFLAAAAVAAVVAYRAKVRAEEDEAKAATLLASHNRLQAANISGTYRVVESQSLLQRAGGVIQAIASALCGGGDDDGRRRRALERPLLGETSNFSLAPGGDHPLLADPRDFTAEELCAATDNFAPANKLDEGACGAVFRGKLPGGQPIAIKVLKVDARESLSGGSGGSGSSGGAGAGWGGAGGDPALAVTHATAWTSIVGEESAEESGEDTLDTLSPLAQFRREAEVLLVYRHANIVTLLGTCFDARASAQQGGGKRHYLVMEQMEGGSLKDRLRPPNAPPSGWDGPVLRIALTPAQRFQVVADVARALSFLHNEAKPAIIHHDVKSANILMGTDPVTGAFVAKMADFGAVRKFTPELAVAEGQGRAGKRHQRERSHMKILDIIGTEAYMPHEYTREGRVSEKTDSYAFGVVCLEVLTGRPPTNPLTKEFLAEELMDALETPETTLPQLLDRRCAGQWPLDKALALARIARRCIDLQWRKRCALVDVLPELNQLADHVPPLPSPPPPPPPPPQAPAGQSRNASNRSAMGSEIEYSFTASHASQYNQVYG